MSSENNMNRIFTLDGLNKYTVLRRANRFVVTVRRGNRVRRALLRNTGRLNELIANGRTALCLERTKGKTSCEIIGILVNDDKAALIDPYTQARIFEICHERKLIPWLGGWKLAKKEVKVGMSRIDYKITNGIEDGYLELKSAAYYDGYYAMYPDCPSERGLRHINTLNELNTDGYRCIITFMAAHPYAEALRPNSQADAELASRLKYAHEQGVEVHAMKIFLDANGDIFLADPDIPIELP
jgi:sugar fermentation stimulation protein A